MSCPGCGHAGTYLVGDPNNPKELCVKCLKKSREQNKSEVKRLGFIVDMSRLYTHYCQLSGEELRWRIAERAGWKRGDCEGFSWVKTPAEGYTESRTENSEELMKWALKNYGDYDRSPMCQNLLREKFTDEAWEIYTFILRLSYRRQKEITSYTRFLKSLPLAFDAACLLYTLDLLEEEKRKKEPAQAE